MDAPALHRAFWPWVGLKRAFGVARIYRTLAVVLAVALAAMLALSPTPAKAQSYRFASVTVEGNRQIDAASIMGMARVPLARALSEAELNAAYQRVIGTGFFRSVEFLPTGNRLIIRVEEYPLINRVVIEGNRRLRDDQLMPLIRSRPGGVFSPVQAEADANALAEAYAAAGRLGARITPRIIERQGGGVDLVFEVTEGRVVEIQRISFVGNRSFSDSRLRNAIASAQAGRLSFLFQVDNYNPERIARDRQVLEDFYRSRGFVDAEVTAATTELARERDAVFVTFTIREGQQYRFGQVSVRSEIPGVDPAPYERALTRRTGQLFTPQALETLIQQAEDVGIQAGERFLRAEPRLTRNEQAGVIDVELVLVRGPRVFVERIDIQGNTTTEDRVIRRQFDFAEGDPLNPRQIREAAARIRKLGYFSAVGVNPVRGSAPDLAVVDVQVEETTTGSLGFGLSYSGVEGVGANLRYSENNFLGRGQRVSLTLSTVKAARTLDFSFTEPALLGRDLLLGLQLGYTTTEESTYAAFGSQLAQFAPTISFPISRYGRLSLNATLQRDRITVVPPPADDAPDTIAARLRQDADLGAVNTAIFGVTYSYDDRLVGPDPDRGAFARLTADVAGGQRQWLRATALFGYERKAFFGDVTLRAEFEAGIVRHMSGASRVTERFGLGPAQFRGFAPYGVGPVGFAESGARNGLGGNQYAVLRLDAEFPLGLPSEYNISGGMFFDVGTLRGIDSPGTLCPPGVQTDCVVDTGSLRAAVGVALIWRSPIGPLRFNFAHPVRREPFDRPLRFDLTIASSF